MNSYRAVRPALVGRLFFFLCCTLLLCSATTPANGFELSDAQLTHLSSHPTWLRLLHVPVNTLGVTDEASEINSIEFFISGDRFSTAKNELNATLLALKKSSSSKQPQTSPDKLNSVALINRATNPAATEHAVDDPNRSILCRFPARAYWLSKELNQPNWRDFSQCTRLNEWAKLDTLESLSLIMISGYFGNPASTFGHSLLRLNNNSFREKNTLLDLGINFGAQVPPAENTVVYILRGLFGGYQSGFSDRTFYEHDQTYNRIEFRDRWEYTLNLTESQRNLLVLHLWEITGKKFTYFFIHQNCSYRLAELLELATDNEITEQVRLWYAPVTLFHDMRRLSLASGEPLFTDIEYIPSIEQLLRERMAALNSKERSILMQLITQDDDTALKSLGLESQQLVLSTALDYFEYRLTTLGQPDAPKETPALIAHDDAPKNNDITARQSVEVLKQNAIQLRLALPVSSRIAIPSNRRIPPSALDPPSVLNTGYGYKESLGGYLNLNYSAYQHKAIGRNTYQQSALVVFDLTLAAHNELGIFVDSLDFIRARKTNAPSYFLPNESRHSWEIGLGLETTRRDCIRCMESFIEGSVGRSKRLGNDWLVDASMGGRLSSKDSAIELIPTSRVIYSPSQNWSSEMQVSWWHSPTRGRDSSKMRYQLELRYSLANNQQIIASFDQYYELQGRVSFGWRW